MSAELASTSMSRAWIIDPRERHILRYAVGATLAMAIAMGVAWDLSFLVPVLSLSFLAAPGPAPDLRKGIGIVAIIAVACFAGLWAIKYLIAYPIPFFLVFGLALLRIYYAISGGANPFLVLWLFIAVTVLPLIAVQSPDLAHLIVRGIILGAAVTMFVVWISHVLVPDLPRVGLHAEAKSKTKATTPKPTRSERTQLALTQTLVVYPMFLLFHFFEWTGGILVLVFVALLSMQPGFAKDFKAGKAMILGNLIGGAAAILMFEVLTVVPQFPYLILLTFLAGLFFGSRLMSTRKSAALYGMAFSTLLLVIGSVTTSTGDATSKVYSRIFQIMMAVVYVVVAFGLIERYRRAFSGGEVGPE